MTCMPVESDMYVTSPFGPRQGGFHYGTDFGAAGGSGGRAVYAARRGTLHTPLDMSTTAPDRARGRGLLMPNKEGT